MAEFASQIRKPQPAERKFSRAIIGAGVVIALAVVVVVALEATLALCGVRPLAYDEDPYVGFTSWEPLFVADPDSDNPTMLVTARNKQNLFNVQRFSDVKPKGAYRIFCLGGSTTYGRPFNDSTSFSAWLRRMLPQADPSHEWEVINAGGISYASYRIAQMMEELVVCSPDLFIVYTGHNEFLEERTYRNIQQTPAPVRELLGGAGRTRIFTLASRLRKMLESKKVTIARDKAMLPGEVSAILDESVGPEAYRRDDELRRNVLKHFRLNLGRLVDIADSAGAGIMFIAPASNLRDFSPFKSEHRADISDEERRRFDAAMEMGTLAFDAGRYADAVGWFEQCVAIDSRHAEAQFRLGSVLWALERFHEAGRALRIARDEDICPLRAVTAIQDIVTDVAEARGVPLVDFWAMGDAEAPHGVPGAESFVDHVHPTIERHGLLAEAILLAMVEMDQVRLSKHWDGSVVAGVAKAVQATIDDDTRAQSRRNLAKVMGWAGKFKEAYALSRQALELSSDDPESSYGLAVTAANVGREEELRACLEKTLRLMPNHAGALLRLGNAMSAQGDTEKAAECFRRLIDADDEMAYLGHNNLANELAAQGRTEEAIAHYRAALLWRPDYVAARGNLGLALASTRRTDEAVAQYKIALATDPENGPIHFNLGVLLLDLGKTGDALEHLRTAAALMPDYVPVHEHLGRALQHAGQGVD